MTDEYAYKTHYKVGILKSSRRKARFFLKGKCGIFCIRIVIVVVAIIVMPRTILIQFQEELFPNSTVNMTFDSFDWSNYSGHVEVRLVPTDLRLDRIYIRVYILWMNMIVQIVGPFLGLSLLVRVTLVQYHPYVRSPC